MSARRGGNRSTGQQIKDLSISLILLLLAIFIWSGGDLPDDVGA